MNEPLINARIMATNTMVSALCATHPDLEALRAAYMARVQHMREFVALVEQQFDAMLTTCRLA